MGKLENWNFCDHGLNNSIHQVNRQKSAIELEIKAIDKKAIIGIFWDKRNGEIKASIDECECKDFNFAGKSPRKKFAPCMHIYRLAIEMDLMTPVYFNVQEAARRDHIKLLQEKKAEPGQWGGWSFKIHLYNVQRKRQISAYDIKNELHKIDKIQKCGQIHGYDSTLKTCTCQDFIERKLPCKHIYCLALLLGESLEVSPLGYTTYKNEGTFY